MTLERNTVVVGGGLVGPMCALLLAKRGYNVRLYEKRNDPRTFGFTGGRSINLSLSNRGRKALKEVGLEEEIIGYGTPMKGRLIHSISKQQKQILYDARNKQCTYSVPRDVLNKKLIEALDKYPNVTLYFNYKLTCLDNREGVLKFLNLVNNETCEVKADLIIGADGAFSRLRLGIQSFPSFNFSQKYIDHGYIEMSISPQLGSAMVPNFLHIWPRGEFMMIALPNNDKSWTVTLFMPLQRFQELDSKEKVLNFFKKVFPDSVPLLEENQIINKILNKIPSFLVSIKCNNYYIGKNVLLIGDAAHAMVPFYGQGMNCGFEDCSILNSFLNSYNDDIAIALKQYSDKRVKDANAICDLSMYNYVEMRDLVTRPTYLMRKTFDDLLFQLFPNFWIPLYISITFSDMDYRDCIKNRHWQNKIIMTFNVSIALLFLAIFWSKV